MVVCPYYGGQRPANQAISILRLCGERMRPNFRKDGDIYLTIRINGLSIVLAPKTIRSN
jgi:hypothetical protein